MKAKFIEELARKLATSLPPGLHSIREELEQNFRVVLESGLNKAQLVTREEFDIQRRVLERSRDKLEALEARIAELEERNAAPH